jgi:hypothetical protein
MATTSFNTIYLSPSFIKMTWLNTSPYLTGWKIWVKDDPPLTIIKYRNVSTNEILTFNLDGSAAKTEQMLRNITTVIPGMGEVFENSYPI